MTSAAGERPLLEVAGLSVRYAVGGGALRRPRGYVRAVDGVSLEVRQGETFGLVGESGCGKSTLARAMLRLVEPSAGRILFEGRDLTALQGEELRRARRDFQMIFQDPYASLNPRLTVKDIVGEPLLVHGAGDRRARAERVRDLLELVGLGPHHARRKPAELSGGQRQRVGIARALALHPRLVVADEAVSALDVSIQAQILNLLQDLQEQMGTTYVFISHNLSVVKHLGDRVGVMYLGRLVETAAAGSIYQRPLHPYTQALLSAIPMPDPAARRERALVEGEVPDPASPPSGCVFHPRCRFRMDHCASVRPELRPAAEDHLVACHLYGGSASSAD